MIALVSAFFHRFLGYVVGLLLNRLLGTEAGAFQFEIGWIALRLGLDQNEIIITNFVWKNPPRFKVSPFLFKVDQLLLRFSMDTLYKAITKGSSITVHYLEINRVDFYMEKGNKGEGLNMWAAFGAESVEQEKSVESFIQKCIANARDAMKKAQDKAGNVLQVCSGACKRGNIHMNGILHAVASLEFVH